jgi:hypothetical protein
VRKDEFVDLVRDLMVVASVMDPLDIEVDIACSEFDVLKYLMADEGISHLAEKKVGLSLVGS